MVCLRPFDLGLLDNSTGKFVVANQYCKDGGRNPIYPNAFMASPRQHSLLDIILETLPVHKDKAVLFATGPNFLTSILTNTSNAGKWKALAFEEVFAQEWDSRRMCNSIGNCRAQFPQATTVSLWTHSWKKGSHGSEGRDWHHL